MKVQPWLYMYDNQTFYGSSEVTLLMWKFCLIGDRQCECCWWSGMFTATALANWYHKEAGSLDVNDLDRILILSLVWVFVGGTMASWLARSTPERVLQVRALARDIVLCSWARHFTLMVSLSTQVYKWVPANLMLGITLWWTSIPSRGE